ncbi:MAG: hypothetical protein JSS32_01625 [Verrucomicrobia bacterium]|nr:hypothetical protein [Verrucomicrobiota bacterium]
MSTQLENDLTETHDDSFLQQSLPQYYRSIIRDFRRITKNFVAFNLGFVGLILTELTLFFIFLPFLSQSYILAFALGGFFLTCFSYLVLLFYFQAKKPEQLSLLRDRFISSCKQVIGLPSGTPQYHLSIAAALLKLSSYLQDFEWHFYQIPKWLNPLSRILTRFFAYCHWNDVFKMKQHLLYSAIEEHLEQIRMTPTDLEVHASLANTYVALSQIYLEPKMAGSTHPRLNAYRKEKALFEDKFRTAARLAMEEFQILNHYAPNDPWVHEQLAVGYRDLQLPQEEIREVETLLKLRPLDRDTLFRLGSLYFEQGQNAKGLQVYEELKRAHYKRAENLISTYGSLKNLTAEQ